MKKGIFLKLSMGVALAAAVAVCWTPAARAELSSGSDTFTYSQGASTLVMPFDQTGTHVSFQTVSFTNVSISYFIGGIAGPLNPPSQPGDPIATHWSFWSDSCEHIRDVTICLTIGDTIVVDPTKLHGEIQQENPPANNPTTPDFNIGPVRGSVFVTAFAAFTGSSGEGCSIANENSFVDNVIVGSWTIADTSTNAAFGANAVGLSGVDDFAANVEFDYEALENGGLKLQSFNPQSLGDSDVIVLTVDSGNGFGEFEGFEWGPIPPGQDGVSACCDVVYQDNLEVETSHPEFCFGCTGFIAISKDGSPDDCAPTGDGCLLPDEINRPGVLHLQDCQSVNGDLPLGPISEDGSLVGDFDQYLFAFHNQAVGQFGVTVHAVYTGEAFSAL